LQHGLGHAIGLGGGGVGAQQVVEGGVGRQAAFLERFPEDFGGFTFESLEFGANLRPDSLEANAGQPKGQQIDAQDA